MQRVIFNEPTTSSPRTNTWFTARRAYHVRKLYASFHKLHTTFVECSKNDIVNFDNHNILLGTDHSTGVGYLKDLSHRLFPKNTIQEQYGYHLNWALQGLFHAIVKLKENLRMYHFHHGTQPPEAMDPAHTIFIEGLVKDATKELKAVQVLFDNAKQLLRFMLVNQTENDILMRLLIEEDLSQTLWNESTLDLFADLFPDQPEAGYVLAGKSYFMSSWLEEALHAYEKSLTINKDLSEPRRQTYLIRAMIKDRDKR